MFGYLILVMKMLEKAGTMAVAAGEGLVTLDISDPFQPYAYSHIPLGFNAAGLAANSKFAFLWEEDVGVKIYRIVQK